MAEASATMIAEQMSILRDIRDELKISRASGSLASDSVTRPSSTGIHRQTWADQMALNQHASFQWTVAYQHLYRPTLGSDVMGSMGLTRAPSSMTQSEFEQVSGENLRIRGGAVLGGIFMPGYTRQTSSLADSIYSNSYRFLGNSTNPLGQGSSRTHALDLARQVMQVGAGDTRMSTQDYATVTQRGLESGQFDDLRTGSGDFISQVKLLATETANLTRVLHTSVDDISRAMGNLRMAGVTDVPTQSRIITNMGATARAAGVTLTDMIGATQSAIQFGMTTGMSAETSAGLASQNVLFARAAVPAGLVSGAQMAAGGGALGVAQQITQYQQRQAGTDYGFLSLMGRRGGAGSNSINQALTGLEMYAGQGLYGALEMNRERFNVQQTASADEIQKSSLDFVRTQIRMMGETDMTSGRSQSLAYAFLRGQGMEDAPAYTMAAENFSQAGIVARDRSKLRAMREGNNIERKRAGDEAYLNNTFAGRWLRAESGISQGFSRAGAWLGSRFEENAGSGATGLGYGRLGRATDEMMSGMAIDPGSVRSRIAALARGTPAGAADEINSLDVEDPTSGAFGVVGTAGAIAGLTIAGVASGGLIPALAFGAGAIALTAGFTDVASFGTAVVGSLPGMGPRRLNGEQARLYQRGINASRLQINTQQASDIFAKNEGRGRNSLALKDFLTQDTPDGTAGSLAMMEKAQKAAAEAGLSVEEVVQLRTYSGRGMGLANAHIVDSGPGGFDADSFKTTFSKLLGGDAKTIQANFGISENMSAVGDFVTALDSGNVESLAKTQRSLQSTLGLSDEQLGGLTRNVKGMSSEDRKKLLSSVKAGIEYGGSRALNRDLRNVMDMADTTLLGMDPDSRTSAAKGELDAIRKGGDYRKLLDSVMSDKSSLGSVLREQGGVWAEMGGIASAEDLRKMSADDIRKKYRVDEGSANELVKQMADGMDPEVARKALALTAAVEGGKEVEGPTQDMRVSALLNQAARTLERTANILQMGGLVKPTEEQKK